MPRERRTLTLTWRSPDGSAANRVTVPLRWAQIGAGGLLAALLGAVVLGAVALRLQQQSAALHARIAAAERDRAQLAEELAGVRREMDQARDNLSRVRSEEAKIRSWLGLEAPPETPDGEAATLAPAPAPAEGGKGSLGDEGLETVSPGDRSTEAEPAARSPGADLLAASRSLAADLADLAVYVQEQKAGWDAIPAISPVDGEHWISSSFGWRASPFTGKREFHSGLDLAGRRGTPVVATADGRVYRVFDDRALGRGLSIDHGNGIRTIYGHLDSVAVEKGQAVTRGQLVGAMGSTGKRSTGPHVHYAVKVDGQYVNPRAYLLDRARPGTAVARN